MYVTIPILLSVLLTTVLSLYPLAFIFIAHYNYNDKKNNHE